MAEVVRSVLAVEAIEVITAIHHPTRRRMVDQLILHQPMQVGALAAALDLQVGSVSHHLRMLRKAGVVEQVPDPTGDGRRSWWQMARTSFSWAPSDFASPAEKLQAREAERASLAHQSRRLHGWLNTKGSTDPEWCDAAFSADSLAWATPEELHDLMGVITEAVQQWRTSIDTEDGQTRRPVYVFAHGFPTEA